jgi:hypothetical protein
MWATEGNPPVVSGQNPRENQLTRDEQGMSAKESVHI